MNSARRQLLIALAWIAVIYLAAILGWGFVQAVEFLAKLAHS